MRWDRDFSPWELLLQGLPLFLILAPMSLLLPILAAEKRLVVRKEGEEEAFLQKIRFWGRRATTTILESSATNEPFVITPPFMDTLHSTCDVVLSVSLSNGSITPPQQGHFRNRAQFFHSSVTPSSGQFLLDHSRFAGKFDWI